MTPHDAYTTARDWLAFLIDHPDKSVSVSDYQTQLLVAKLNVANAHKTMMEAWG